MRNELNPDHEDFDLEVWAEHQWQNWPDIVTDLQFGLNFETYEFNYCVAYHGHLRFQIDMRLNPPTIQFYKVKSMIDLTNIEDMGGI